MRISDWSSDVCSSDLDHEELVGFGYGPANDRHQTQRIGPVQQPHAHSAGQPEQQVNGHARCQGDNDAGAVEAYPVIECRPGYVRMNWGRKRSVLVGHEYLCCDLWKPGAPITRGVLLLCVILR